MIPKVESLKDKLPKNEKGGVKADDGKLQPSLLPASALQEITKVLMVGAKKYSADNWRKVERSRYVDAMMRHYLAWRNGEAIDKDDGLTHLAHLGCNILFLIELYGDEPFKLEV